MTKMLQELRSHTSKYFLFVFLFLLTSVFVFAQQVDEPTVIPLHDTVPVTPKTVTLNRYDSAMKAHSPKTAAIRSALLPGLGQIYNKKYWKLPIIYGALGTTGAVFFYNLKNYRNTKFAYRVKYNMQVFHTDSALYAQIKSNLQPLSVESLKFYRNQFRRDIDYSVLVFVLLWGLNVVDAAVDAHLKSFDVGPDLSLQLKPGHSEMAGTNGLSLVLKLGK